MSAIEQYLSLIDGADAVGNVRQIAQSLLALLSVAVALKDTPFVDFPPLPVDEYFADAYNRVCKRFPMLGLYGSGSANAEDIGVASTAGDAIDDLADIYHDLSQVEWVYKKGHHEAALWHFRNSFEIHWGRHASELLLNLIVTQLV